MYLIPVDPPSNSPLWKMLVFSCIDIVAAVKPNGNMASKLASIAEIKGASPSTQLFLYNAAVHAHEAVNPHARWGSMHEYQLKRDYLLFLAAAHDAGDLPEIDWLPNEVYPT